MNDESAAFTVIAAIAMQGVRIASPTIGVGLLLQDLVQF